ncbi:MAG: hypothetical protein RMN51_09250 [Verrucomicrobiota bacterium]|nr:hypothetical protein [Limisphaera sp.]MDW8382277.1 hypothetical protein [Verrucomicrobiota bacterium]
MVAILWAVPLLGEVYRLSDGSSLEGSPVSANERGVVFRLPDGRFSDRVPWDRLAQESLRELAKQPRFARYAEPYVFEEENVKPTKPPLPKPQPVEGRLSRPDKPSVWGGLWGSPLGLVVLLALYAANLYAAYEVSIFRAQPAVLVCGLAAVCPVIPQVVFLAMPTRIPPEEAESQAAAEAAAAPALGAGLHLVREAPSGAATAAAAQPTVFKRGEYAFNRRFFETRFSAFFGMIRRDKSQVMILKTSKQQYTVNRITRITGTDMHVEVQKGAAIEEIPISFTEIVEVELRPSGGR